MINKAQASLQKIVSLRARHCFSGGRSNLVFNSMGQATLEFTLIFVIMVALLMGLLGLWKWSSDNIIKRQGVYNSTRVEAGSRTPGMPDKWYGATDFSNNSIYLTR